MLEFIRRHAHSLVAKVFLTILAGSFFLFFGFSYVVDKIMGKDYIVKISNIKISPQYFKYEKSKRLEALNKRGAKDVDSSSITKTVLHQLVWENLINLAAGEFGLVVSDSTMYAYVENMGMFRREDGHFDASVFRRFLKGIQVSEAEFLEASGREIKTHLMKAPFKYVSCFDELDYYANIKSEKRSLVFTEINPSTISLKDEPSDEDLMEFFNNNSDLFIVPEVRSFRVLEFSESKIESDVKVSDDEVKEAYEFSEQREERSFDEMKAELIADIKQNKVQAKIDELTRGIEDDLMSGTDIEEVANKHGLKVFTANNVKLNDENKVNLPYAQDVMTVAFSQDEKEVASFSESLDKQKHHVQWLVYVDNIVPQHVDEFEKVKNRVKAEWKKDQKHSKAIEMANDIVAKVSAGEKFSSLGYKTQTTSMFDREGLLGAKKDGEKIIKEVFAEAFEKQKGDVAYREINDRIVVYQVNEIKHEEIPHEEKMKDYGSLLQENAEDLYQQLIGYLSKKYEVKVNYELLKTIDESSESSIPEDGIL